MASRNVVITASPTPQSPAPSTPPPQKFVIVSQQKSQQVNYCITITFLEYFNIYAHVCIITFTSQSCNTNILNFKCISCGTVSVDCIIVLFRQQNYLWEDGSFVLCRRFWCAWKSICINISTFNFLTSFARNFIWVYTFYELSINWTLY